MQLLSLQDSSLECQVEILSRKVQDLIDEVEGLKLEQQWAKDREDLLRDRVLDLELGRIRVRESFKKDLDQFLETEGGWLKFEFIYLHFGMSRSQWSKVKKVLLALYPDEYEEQVRQSPGNGRGRRPMEFRRRTSKST